jgi:hypothetical protein
MKVEVFADGIATVRIVGDVLRMQFVGLSEDGRIEPRALIVVPVAGLDGMIDILTKARGSRLAAINDGETAE